MSIPLNLNLSLRERFKRNLHPCRAWYIIAICMIPRRVSLPFFVMSARIEYDTTSYVMFVRKDGTPYCC
jgi:hypothetical protein